METDSTKAVSASPGLWALVARGEPFRVLFPLGLALGVIGVALWPLYVAGWLTVYPAIMHPRIMIEGFITSFVIGFLGTALPRLLDVPRITLAETLVAVALIVTLSALHLAGWTLAGDVVFFVTLVLLILALGFRAKMRRDTPPPGFVLVAMGLACALIGAAIPLLAALVPLPAWMYSLWPQLLYEGYLLLPIMGIGAFLLPRFFGLPNRATFPESLALPPGWLPRAGFAAACGLGVIATFVIEAAGGVRLGSGVRAAIVLYYFWREVPVHQAAFAQGTLSIGMRIALFSLPAGYFLIACWPQFRMAWMHIILITGFSLLVFTIASRVVLGHGGKAHLFKASLRPVWVMITCLVLAMLTRVSADMLPSHRFDHFAFAAILWITGALVWGVAVLGSVRHADSE